MPAARRLVDRRHDALVLQPLFAGSKRRTVVQDAVGEVIELGGELILFGDANLFVLLGLALSVTQRQAEATIGVRRIHAVVRLVLDAVGDHELFVGALARGDHLLGFGGAVGHRLFAQHVFAGLRGAHGVLGVQTVRQDDVDRLDFGVVAQLVVVLVGIDLLGRKSVDARSLLRFVYVDKNRRLLNMCVLSLAVRSSEIE